MEQAREIPLIQDITFEALIESCGLEESPSDGSDPIYYPDRLKEYKYTTSKQGIELLKQFLRQTSEMMKLAESRMEDKVKAKEEGWRLYEKPNKNGTQTWTEVEYKDVGLQYYYLCFKSIQRFTEMWNLLERAHRQGSFDKLKEAKVAKIISLGGGPGIELVACRIFMKQTLGLDCELTTLDLVSEWKPYADILNCQFIQSDFCRDDFMSAIEDKDLIILCYAMKYFPAKKLDEVIEKRKILLINDGFKSLTRLEAHRDIRRNRAIDIIPLVGDRDERQCVVAHREMGLPVMQRYDIETTFPNVPYTHSIKAEKERKEREARNRERGSDRRFNDRHHDDQRRDDHRRDRSYGSHNNRNGDRDQRSHHPYDRNDRNRRN
eukprot:TRINITY_DN3624_c0_g1_i1.p1 TRINITY_DN3624_c0_g1~~TRINITY_DN3624_c0_g1_i1.p1  ORF type:complete len:378 (-),score=74.41 TRINITY_DN3624_c0_g1_i1:10-1143(-)